MLNAQEADAAVKALVYPSFDTTKREDRPALRAAYNEAEAKITEEFREWLIHEYASNFPVALQNRLLDKAWSDGHHAGYHEVENYFEQYAELAEFAINAVK